MHKPIPTLKVFMVREHCDLVTFASVGSRTVKQMFQGCVIYVMPLAINTGLHNLMLFFCLFVYTLK